MFLFNDEDLTLENDDLCVKTRDDHDTKLIILNAKVSSSVIKQIQTFLLTNRTSLPTSTRLCAVVSGQNPAFWV